MNFSKVSVPGNLLLAGEYAVLEKEGLGITLAPDIRIFGEVRESKSWIIEGKWNGGGESFGFENRNNSFLGRAFQNLCIEFKITQNLNPHKILIDSSNFYFSNGRKTGLGSSAAAVVCLAALLLRILGISLEKIPAKAFLPAVRSHRAGQEGKGSGYDVAASLFGGWGLFQGGENPSYRSIDFPWFEDNLYLFFGKHQVKTSQAVSGFSQWKKEHSNDYLKWFAKSNKIVKEIAKSKSSGEVLGFLEEAKKIGIAAGRFSGKSAEIDLPEFLSGSRYYKALGAGNEAGLAVNYALKDFKDKAEVLKLNVAREGLVWE